MLRILKFDNLKEVKSEMQKIGVDRCGIDIMLPKTTMHLLEVDRLPTIGANILKQELLSLGADAAVSRASITGRSQKTPVFIFGTQAQLSRLSEKLKRQPFGLDKIGLNIKEVLENSYKNDFKIKARNHTLNLTKKTYVMGVINVTPDSFSGDGLCELKIDSIIRHAEKMVKDGADILDIGGESSRPGAKPVSLKEELQRITPIIKKLSKRIKIPISIDTYKSAVAEQAIDNGASIVNDISGLRFDPKMAKVISKTKAAVVVMHIKGRPRNMQKNPRYKDVVGEVIDYLKNSLNIAQRAGVSQDKIIIDPGIGFGKTTKDNLTILKKLNEFKSLGFPLLIGVSRKSFIGNVLNVPVEQRLIGTAASVAFAVSRGANIVRVHDVKEISQVVKIINNITR